MVAEILPLMVGELKLTENMQNKLPTVEQISNLLQGID